MSENKSFTCPSCGARNSGDETVCVLCGESQQSGGALEAIDREQNPPAEAAASREPDREGVFCNACGWKNPVDANFCSSCGTGLQKEAVSSTPDAGKKQVELPRLPPEQPETIEPVAAPRNMGVQTGLMILVSLVVVAALYMLTIASRTAFPPGIPDEPPASEAAASSEGTQTGQAVVDLEAQAGAIQQEIAGLEGEALITRLRELTDSYRGSGQPSLAALAQEELAGSLNTSEAWAQTGNRFYEWMEVLSGEQRQAIAQRAADAYQRSLELEEDLNIRTALAMSFLNSQTPMFGVREIRAVLDTEPDHIQGNFYYGVMLMQISRLDQALEQFEKVKQLVGPDSPMYGQADMLINNIRTLGGN